MKKKLICALMTATMAGSLVSGLTVSADSDSQVTISLYTTLPNKDSQFEQLCEEFMEENPDIKVNYIAYDSSEKQKWMTLYAKRRGSYRFHYGPHRYSGKYRKYGSL